MPVPSESSDVEVLVIDDEEDILELSSRALRRAGISVASARDFGELERVLEKTTPRLILMDVQMPELFGDDVARILRDQRGVKAQVILYSSLDPDYLAKLAVDAGVDGWLSKSAGIAQLVKEVLRLLGRADKPAS